MITRIEALGFRTLRYVAQDSEPFQVLVGPNGSGKSSFLDVVGFVGDLLRVGPWGPGRPHNVWSLARLAGLIGEAKRL